MRTGFIGAGKVGFTLGKYFSENGVHVTGYYSRNRESAIEAANFTGTTFYETLQQLVLDSEIVFLTVPDNTVKTIWDALKPLQITGKIICHCSGALPSSIFGGIAKKQAYACSVHPFFAISSKHESYKELHNTFFTLEGDKKCLGRLKAFIENMGNDVHIITQSQKIKYHCAAVFLSNHVSALAYTGSKLLKECGFEDEVVSKALKTLFINHCAKIAEKGATETLTGPVERNDMQTVKKHMACIENNELALYGVLSKQLIEIAKKKHANFDYTALDTLITNKLEGLV